MVDTLEMYILIFFTYSFLGWFMESVGGILKEKKFINRGFLIGPYCPVYGTGVVLITFLLKKYTNDIPALFCLSTLICGILEYSTSFFMEKLFNARWWDYSNRKFNINGRICLETLLPFGIAGTAIICIVNPFFVGIYEMLPVIALNIIAYGLLCIFIIDSIISFRIILSFKKETYQKRDNTEEISNKVKDKAEDMIMKAESDAIVFSRRLKLRELKFQRKMHFTGNKIYRTIKSTPKEFAEKVSEGRNNVNAKIQRSKSKIDSKIKDAKQTIETKQKESMENLDSAIKNIKMSSEEFTKQVKEKFRKESIFKRRLVNAFPNLKISENIKSKIEKKKVDVDKEENRKTKEKSKIKK